MWVLDWLVGWDGLWFCCGCGLAFRFRFDPGTKDGGLTVYAFW